MPTWALSCDGYLMVRVVALYLGGWALDPQKFGRVAEYGPVIKFDLERLFLFLQPDFGRARGFFLPISHCLPAGLEGRHRY